MPDNKNSINAIVFTNNGPEAKGICRVVLLRLL